MQLPGLLGSLLGATGRTRSDFRLVSGRTSEAPQSPPCETAEPEPLGDAWTWRGSLQTRLLLLCADPLDFLVKAFGELPVWQRKAMLELTRAAVEEGCKR